MGKVNYLDDAIEHIRAGRTDASFEALSELEKQVSAGGDGFDAAQMKASLEHLERLVIAAREGLAEAKSVIMESRDFSQSIKTYDESGKPRVSKTGRSKANRF